MKLPKIYEHFGYGQIFTIDEAREKLETTGNTLRKRLSELSSRNYIHPIRQGLYRVARPGEMPDERESSPFHVASRVTAQGYVAFQTALELHAGASPAAGGHVYVVSATKFNSFQFEGRLFFWCQNPDADGVESLDVVSAGLTVPVRVTTFEKTIVDCLKRTAHSPPLARLVELCVGAHRKPDLDRLMRLASECHVAALFNRLGYFMECMAPHWDVDSSFVADVERRMSRKVTDWPLTPADIPVDAPADSLASAEADASAANGATEEASRQRWKVNFPHHHDVIVASARQGAAAKGVALRIGAEVAEKCEEESERAEEIPWFHA